MRRLLILIAIVALAMMGERANRFRQRAEDHAVLEERCRQMRDDDRQSLDRFHRERDDLFQKHWSKMREREAEYRSIYQRQNKSSEEIERLLSERRSSMEQQLEGLTTLEKRREGEITGSLASDEVFILWHAALKSKYRRAMRLPWLPVSPDSPPPE